MLIQKMSNFSIWSRENAQYAYLKTRLLQQGKGVVDIMVSQRKRA